MPATQNLVPPVEANIDLALGIQRDGKAWPNYVDPEALETNPHFSGEKHPWRQVLELRSPSLPFS